MSAERIPEGWSVGSVADLGQFLNGLAFRPDDWGAEGLPIIRIQNLTNPEKPFNYTMRIIDPRFLVTRGDFLVSWSATLDTFKWTGPNAVLNQHIFKVVPHESYDRNFVYYLLKHAIANLRGSTGVHGSTMTHINRGPFLSYPICIPPLAEQRRIVAAIEAHLTRLDAAVAALRRVQANLKRYRAAVLKAACEGRLVPTEAERWTAAKLGDLLERSEYGTSVRCDYGASGPPVLRIPNIARGSIDLSDLKFATTAIGITEETRLRRGDILVCRTNGSVDLVGRSAVVQQTFGPRPHTFASYLLRLRFREPQILPRWTDIWLRSPSGRAAIERAAASSAGQHNISLSWLQRLEYVLPPLAEQRRIVAEVERRLSVVDEVAASVAQQLARAERLRQAVLKRAFAGRLAPQDPADEPASALLERIRAARAAAGGVTGMGRKAREVELGRAKH